MRKYIIRERKPIIKDLLGENPYLRKENAYLRKESVYLRAKSLT